MTRNKVLFVANIHKHFNAFHLPYIKYLQEQGYEVHVAANDPETRIDIADKQYDLSINRNPFSLKNIKAIRELNHIIGNEQYKLIHCHTAMGSVVSRLAAKTFRKNGDLKVLYTAHGFHFYKGSPKRYWLLYYPVEKYLSGYTDVIITINQEDYELIINKNFENNKTYKISGVGVKKKKFEPVNSEVKNQIRSENGFQKEAYLVIYAAEYIHRKNHDFILDCAKKMKELLPNLKILLAGRGVLFDHIRNRILDENLGGFVVQLGFRKDIDKVYKMSDIGISSSRQEGLGLNLVEEMMCGLPVVASEDRGHREIVDHGKNGYLFPQGDVEAFVGAIVKIANDQNLYHSMSEAAIQKAKKFELSNSLNKMKEIYKHVL